MLLSTNRRCVELYDQAVPVSSTWDCGSMKSHYPRRLPSGVLGCMLRECTVPSSLGLRIDSGINAAHVSYMVVKANKIDFSGLQYGNFSAHLPDISQHSTTTNLSAPARAMGHISS
ncbi:hypothetical protein N7537_005343 [Penicillium hordei]|uniref:Uncharacterized protein n=1 Tax=Penicillium hordei TaxID=40994 RepID=A0AAD6E5E7_9EURO|nr:uncharacterized protein N7537_005343 [Penicillium hordei]KAJ5602387.1 hypothetical protein N7537_005343 [Penicillium hordei]